MRATTHLDTTEEVIIVSVVSFVSISSHTHIQTHTHRFSQLKCTNPGLAPARVAMVTTMHVWSKYCISALLFLSSSLSLSSSTLVCKVFSWRSEEFYADVTETTEVSDLLERWSFLGASCIAAWEFIECFGHSIRFCFWETKGNSSTIWVVRGWMWYEGFWETSISFYYRRATKNGSWFLVVQSHRCHLIVTWF